MRLTDYLDKGASLGAHRRCLTMQGQSMSYAQVVDLSYRIAAALARSGIRAGEKVAVLAANDATAFSCVFGISRAGAVWCPINPRNEADENRQLLDFFDCRCLIYQAAFQPLVDLIRDRLPGLRTYVCLDAATASAEVFSEWIGSAPSSAPEQLVEQTQTTPVDDIAMIVGTGGTTGRPKGVMLTGANLETMSAITLMSYPFDVGRPPVYLALAPLTHAAGVLCFPIMTLGGEIVVLPKPDLTEFLSSVARHRVSHTFLPPTLIYMLLAHPALDSTDLSSLRCFWYGAAPMSASRIEEAIGRIGPVMAQLFGQTEAPMMISTMAPADHLDSDGRVITSRLSSAGRPAPLVQLAIMNDDGSVAGQGDRGEIVIRSSLVMAGYYKNPAATAEAGRHGWHHTGDIGYLDADGFLYIVDRAKDMIITGGFNVYSAEVEQALMQHPAIQDCAVIGLPDDKWGERVSAVVQLHPGQSVTAAEVIAFVKARIGSVKAPKQVDIWADLPRSKVGKVLKADIRQQLRPEGASG